MREKFSFGKFLSSEAGVLASLTLFKLLLHLATNRNYGYFRDELYYIACGEHLDWGYVDHPPLIGLAALLSHRLSGGELFLFRLLPALAGAALVLLTGLMVRQLGGGRFAILLAGVAVIIAPYYLFIHTVLTMNAFEPLIWTSCAYLALLILKGSSPRLWLLFGLVAGVGLLNKHSMLLFGFCLVVGMLVTPARKFLFNRWLWLGGLVAFVVFLPNLVWEMRHDWATVEILRNADKNQNLSISPLEFFTGQLMLMHPLNFPVWLAGLYFYLISKNGRRFQPLGVAYLLLFLLLVLLRGKVYYLASVYPVLLAAGGVMLERVFERRGLRWLRPATLALLILSGVALAPMTLPVLPVETFIRYSSALGIQGVRTEQNSWGKLPQHYADMFGWDEMVANVAAAFNSLTPEERQHAAIFADNYGEAGAVDLFGAKYGLPKAISGHQNYYLWGPRTFDGDVLITVSSDREDLLPLFESVEAAGTFRHEYAMPYENNSTVYICRRLKIPIAEFWPKVKCFSC